MSKKCVFYFAELYTQSPRSAATSQFTPEAQTALAIKVFSLAAATPEELDSIQPWLHLNEWIFAL